MLNQIVLVGRITKTPEMMENQDGSKFAIINLAVPRTFKNENGEYDTDFINCTLWTGIAENACKYCKKRRYSWYKGKNTKSKQHSTITINSRKSKFFK